MAEAQGDMLELGHEAPQFRAGFASAVDSSGVRLVFCAGPRMARIYGAPPRHKRMGWAQAYEKPGAGVMNEANGHGAAMIEGPLDSRIGYFAERFVRAS
jgi:UDP-N-acetylmuramoyl-tripeptide--D-alanyl-D-alanine ligase